MWNSYAVVDEKTRRRLDQSLSLLLPRSSTSMSRSKRVRAWEGQASRGEGGGMGAGCEEETLMSASDIATVLGDAVIDCFPKHYESPCYFTLRPRIRFKDTAHDVMNRSCATSRTGSGRVNHYSRTVEST